MHSAPGMRPAVNPWMAWAGAACIIAPEAINPASSASLLFSCSATLHTLSGWLDTTWGWRLLNAAHAVLRNVPGAVRYLYCSALHVWPIIVGI